MSEQMRKACPCCAGDMMVWERHALNTTWQPIIGYRARCQQCRLSTDDYPTLAEAIAAWNQRSTDAELDRLRELERAVRAMREFAPDTLVWQHNYDTIGRLLEGER